MMHLQRPVSWFNNSIHITEKLLIYISFEISKKQTSKISFQLSSIPYHLNLAHIIYIFFFYISIKCKRKSLLLEGMTFVCNVVKLPENVWECCNRVILLFKFCISVKVSKKLHEGLITSFKASRCIIFIFSVHN